MVYVASGLCKSQVCRGAATRSTSSCRSSSVKDSVSIESLVEIFRKVWNVVEHKRSTMSVSVELDEQTAAVAQELAANEQRSASDVIHDALAMYASLGNGPCRPGWGITKWSKRYIG